MKDFKQKKLGLVAAGLVVVTVCGALLLRNSGTKEDSLKISEDSSAVTASVPAANGPTQTDATQAKQTAKPQVSGPQASDDLQRNVMSMTQVLFDFASPHRKATDLLYYLKQSGQEPYTSTNSNPHTGGMMFVRTKKPFKGTRYFHAQYVEGENGSVVIQHMSFEFKPGPKAMALAEEALRTIKPQLGEPHDRSENFMSWKLEDGYHCYIAKLDADYIKEHPFNAYSPEDVGTIKVAIEMDIHP